MGKPILKRMEKKQEQKSSKDEGEKENEELQARYYDVKDSAHFASLNQLQKEFKTLKPEDIINFLLGQSAHTLFRPVRHRFQRRMIIRRKIWESCSADLADLQIFKRFNKKMSYILLIIDNFSNFAILLPLQDKGKQQMRLALEAWLSQIPKNAVKNLHTDRGKRERDK